VVNNIWSIGLVVNTLSPINVVALHWDWLVHGWATVFGQVNHLCI